MERSENSWRSQFTPTKLSIHRHRRFLTSSLFTITYYFARDKRAPPLALKILRFARNDRMGLVAERRKRRSLQSGQIISAPTVRDFYILHFNFYIFYVFSETATISTFYIIHFTLIKILRLCVPQNDRRGRLRNVASAVPYKFIVAPPLRKN